MFSIIIVGQLFDMKDSITSSDHQKAENGRSPARNAIFETFELDDFMNDVICAVCLRNFEEEDNETKVVDKRVMRLIFKKHLNEQDKEGCDLVFHAGCINRWFTTTCPSCNIGSRNPGRNNRLDAVEQVPSWKITGNILN